MLIEIAAATAIGWALSKKRVKKAKGAGVASQALAQVYSVRDIFLERAQQLKDVSRNAVSNVSPKQLNNNINLAVATATLAIIGVGAFLESALVLLGLPGIIFNSMPHFRDAHRIFFKEKRLGIGALDSVIVLACVGTGYFFAAALSNFFFYFSRNLLFKTEDLSKRTLANVFAALPSRVWIVGKEDSIEIEVPLDSVIAGDRVVVIAGGVIPIDGKVIEGFASIDQQSLTGESRPAEKETGDQVLASTIVLSGKIVVSVEKAGTDTVVAKIHEILQHTFDFKTSLQSHGERIADLSAAPMLALGAIALPLVGVNGAIAVVNSNFGVNMRVIAPFATLSFLTLASKMGVLVRDGRVFESLNTVDIVVFDKTGTLTIEQPQVHRVHSFGRYSEDQLLAIAASGEQRQSHPIAKAIQHEANRRKLQLHDIADVQYEIGHGLRVTIDDQDILVGSDRFMTMKQVQLTERVRDIQASSRQRGSSIVLLAIDSEICGVVELDAAVRPEAREVVQSLRQLGKEIHIISGDQEQPTQELAKSLGVDHYFANTLPGHKAKLVEQLQKQGRRVCFVGDGINDSIALKQADVSVSLRGASTIAIDTAQVILMDGKLTHLAAMFELAKEYEGNIRRSFLMTLLPGAVNIGSALFLSTGVILSVILDRVGQLSGVVNGGLPLFRQRNAHEVSEQVESGTTDKNVI